MTEIQQLEAIPQWDLADRMRKALRHSGLGVQEIADYIGVSRNTVSTWINGRIRPGKPVLRLWALRCGVPYGWLVGTDSGNLRFQTPDWHPDDCMCPRCDPHWDYNHPASSLRFQTELELAA